MRLTRVDTSSTKNSFGVANYRRSRIPTTIQTSQSNPEDFGIISSGVLSSFPQINDVKETVELCDKRVGELSALKDVVCLRG